LDQIYDIATHLLQGKFINDRAVLLAAADSAGIKDARIVLEDQSVKRGKVNLHHSLRGSQLDFYVKLTFCSSKKF